MSWLLACIVHSRGVPTSRGDSGRLAAGGPSSMKEGGMHRARVLVVDDDRATRTGLSALLEQAGYSTFATGSFREAMSLLRTDPPDLLITDVRLDEYNGLQLLLTNPNA